MITVLDLLLLLTCYAADLVSMNESFVKARTIFDRMMEDSLAMHSGCKSLVALSSLLV
jgi:signal transducing adaptor molecule